jgi:hypothetical protein
VVDWTKWEKKDCGCDLICCKINRRYKSKSLASKIQHSGNRVFINSTRYSWGYNYSTNYRKYEEVGLERHNYHKLNITLYSFSLNLGSVFLVLILDWFFSSTFYSGDALFFHSNLLHCSGQNSSPNRRWAFLTAYNTVSNRKCKPHHHPDYHLELYI